MFDNFFNQATERQPYPYQRAFAEEGELPDLLKGSLPSIAEIEAELELRDGESSM